jgi:hypothetical protein
VKWLRARKEKEIVGWCVKGQDPPSLPCVVLLTRIGVRKLDGDNLQGGFKHVRDRIAQWIGIDDADPRIDWQYSQERGKPREYAARVTITEVGDVVR